MINDLIKIDSSFNEAMFLTRVNNIFMLLHTAIMSDNINLVKHYLSDELANKYSNIIEQNKQNNVIQMFDEFNVKISSIQSIDITDDKIIINVSLIARYMDYKLDRTTRKYVSGNNKSRDEYSFNLRFEKLLEAKEMGTIRKCPSCGASLDIMKSGECPYCHQIFNAKNYDYILVSIT